MARGGGAFGALLSAVADEWRATPFYRLALNGPEPQWIDQWGADPRTGSRARGAEILAGRWRIGTERLPEIIAVPWGEPPPSAYFTARLHSFSWLRDVAVTPGGTPAVIGLIETWAEGFGEWHPQAWSPDLVAERLYNWLCWGRAAFESGSLEFRPALMRSLGRQARHLAHTAGDVRAPSARIKAGAALTLAGAAALPDSDRLLEVGLELLEEAAAGQFTPDGLHQSRAPEATLEALADFVSADDALLRRGLETPQLVRRLAPKIASILRFLAHADGGLASFHGGGAGDRAALAHLLADYAGESRDYRIAPSSGYFRLQAGECALIMDAGAAPTPAFGERGHAGCLGFELSCGAERIIVNVGSQRELSGDWRAAGRATNGHSTLIVDDELSADLDDRGPKGAIVTGPEGVTAKRTDDDDGARIEARHEGYRAGYGLVHGRTLFLDEAGSKVVGLDQLFRPVSDKRAAESAPVPFAIRFHLHPAATATMRAHNEARIETQAGAHWRLRCDSGALTIEDSVYLAEAGPPQRTRQLVIHGDADPNGAGDAAPNRVIWALTRIDRPAGGA